MDILSYMNLLYYVHCLINAYDLKKMIKNNQDPVIRQISTGDAMCSMITIVNSTVLCI